MTHRRASRPVESYPYNGKVARIYLVAVAILSLVATGYVFYFHTPVVEAIIGQLWGMG